MKKTYFTTLLTITMSLGAFNVQSSLPTPQDGLDDETRRQMQAMLDIDSSPNLSSHTDDQGKGDVFPASSQNGGGYIHHMKADGEGSLAIGINGNSNLTVNQIVGENEGMAIACNQQDIIIDGEKSHIVISAASTSSHVFSNNTTSKIGDLTAKNGGTVIGQNNGTITITRKKKTNL